MLRIPEPEWQRICRQAADEYPGECCGILTTSAGGAMAVHPCRNIQDELHERDPAQYPRDSRIAYFIDPGELFRIVNGAEREGGRVTGFYHSHIDCDAYFSEEDKARAMAWDEPAYPEAVVPRGVGLPGRGARSPGLLMEPSGLRLWRARDSGRVRLRRSSEIRAGEPMPR